jgi:hypothetical protein
MMTIDLYKLNQSGRVAVVPRVARHCDAAKAPARSRAAERAACAVRARRVAPTYLDIGPQCYGRDEPNLARPWMDMMPLHRRGRWEEIAIAAVSLATAALSLSATHDAGYALW